MGLCFAFVWFYGNKICDPSPARTALSDIPMQHQRLFQTMFRAVLKQSLVVPGNLQVLLPLGDQEMSAFAPNLYAGYTASKGFRGHGLPTTLFLEHSLDVIMYQSYPCLSYCCTSSKQVSNLESISRLFFRPGSSFGWTREQSGQKSQIRG